MHKQLVLKIINETKVELFENRGLMASMGNIYNACKLRGLDNHEYLELIIKNLEQEGHFTTVYNKDGILLGVKALD